MYRKEIDKNTKEKFIVEEKEFKGNKFVDVRVYYKDEFDNLNPTKKGIALSYATIPKIIDALLEAVEDSGMENVI